MNEAEHNANLSRLFGAIAAEFAPDAETPDTPDPTEDIQPVGNAGGWKLKFADEFDLPTLNLRNWHKGDLEKADGRQPDFDSKSVAFLTPEQITFRESCAVITAKLKKTNVINVGDKSSYKNLWVPGAAVDTFYSNWINRTFTHQSGMLSSGGDKWGMATTPLYQQNQPALYDFTFGYVEARIKAPVGKGLWPAFWMKRSDQANEDELDIVEIAHSGTATQTVHWEKVANQSGASYMISPADFHVYGMNWQADRIDFYVDGTKTFSVTDVTKIPKAKMYLLLNLAVGGDWPGQPDASTVFPAEMLVDYVRVWQK